MKRKWPWGVVVLFCLAAWVVARDKAGKATVDPQLPSWLVACCGEIPTAECRQTVQTSLDSIYLPSVPLIKHKGVSRKDYTDQALSNCESEECKVCTMALIHEAWK